MKTTRLPESLHRAFINRFFTALFFIGQVFFALPSYGGNSASSLSIEMILQKASEELEKKVNDKKYQLESEVIPTPKDLTTKKDKQLFKDSYPWRKVEILTSMNIQAKFLDLMEFIENGIHQVSVTCQKRNSPECQKKLRALPELHRELDSKMKQVVDQYHKKLKKELKVLINEIRTLDEREDPDVVAKREAKQAEKKWQDFKYTNINEGTADQQTRLLGEILEGAAEELLKALQDPNTYISATKAAVQIKAGMKGNNKGLKHLTKALEIDFRNNNSLRQTHTSEQLARVITGVIFEYWEDKNSTEVKIPSLTHEAIPIRDVFAILLVAIFSADMNNNGDILLAIESNDTPCGRWLLAINATHGRISHGGIIVTQQEKVKQFRFHPGFAVHETGFEFVGTARLKKKWDICTNLASMQFFKLDRVLEKLPTVKPRFTRRMSNDQ